MSKVRTRAGKLKAKRGRPKRADVIRTDSGRISRAAGSDRGLLKTATWKRRSVTPTLSVEAARQQQHGSVLHMWRAQGDLSSAQVDAAEKFHGLQQAWLSAIEAKRQRSSSDFSGQSGHNGLDPFEEGRAERDAATEAAFKLARRVVLESGPLGMMAIEAVVVENQPADNMLGDLRLALNSLARLWKIRLAA